MSIQDTLVADRLVGSYQSVYSSKQANFLYMHGQTYNFAQYHKMLQKPSLTCCFVIWKKEVVTCHARNVKAAAGHSLKVLIIVCHCNQSMVRLCMS